MPKLTIDGMEVEVEHGMTVLQACEQLGIEIPRFCYHERLSIAGNCRMCLVEMERAPKLIASCAMPVGDGMVIHTNSDKVKKGRQGVMEFLLINHPLDCPICDQGGECDLQDQAMAYGYGQSRYRDMKRAVVDKNFGPLIKTHMTRCIQCTRCIRFCEEIAGAPDLGGIGRGSHMEISTYVDRAVNSEMSGNLIDLCPVGALTSKPYAYHARPWELRHTESIDVLDAVGSNIRIDSRGNEVLRVLPRLNEDVNEEWISDKTRFAVDGLRRRRLDRPYVRKDGTPREADWAEALAAVAAKMGSLSGNEMAVLAGDLACAESLYAAKALMTALGSANLDCRQDGAMIDPANRAGYLFNSTIAGIDSADAILLVGCNPRWEAAVINTRIRERYLMGGLRVGHVGAPVDLNYACAELGEGPAVLADLAAGKGDFAQVLKDAQRPMLIVGADIAARADGQAILGLCAQIAQSTGMIGDGWNGFNMLHRAAARVGGLDLGFVPGAGGLDRNGILDAAGKGEVKLVWLLGADEIPMDGLGDAFVIYQGHHGDAGAARADVILPGAAYTEKSGTWVNTEGRVQRGQQAAFPPGEAKEDWAIIRALSDALGKSLAFDSLAELRAAMQKDHPAFAKVGEIAVAGWQAPGGTGAAGSDPLVSPIDNFWQTDVVSRASPTMAECVATFLDASERTGTDG